MKLFINFEKYGLGELEDSQSAIARPWRRLFQNGGDPGFISYVLLRASHTPAFVLGSLCETPGGRLLFFPGCKGRDLSQRFSREQDVTSRLEGIVDHITFETTNYGCHITEVLPDGERRVALKLSRRLEVDSRMHAWFGITLRSLDSLDRAPSKLWFSTEPPVSDMKRRLEIFRKRGTAARMSHLDIPGVNANSFLQINFFIDFDPGHKPRTVVSFLPKGPPELRTDIVIPRTMTAQLHGLPIHDSSAKVQMHPIVWEGDPTNDVAFGF